jgi:hypothetical protein
MHVDGAKGALTRAMNVTNELIEASRSKSEVKQAFEDLVITKGS